MNGKSAIHELSARIVRTISFYLTACGGFLLVIAIVARQMHLVDLDGKLPSPLEETFFFLTTLLFIYIAVRCAGFLAVRSVVGSLKKQFDGLGDAPPTLPGSHQNHRSAAQPPPVERTELKDDQSRSNLQDHLPMNADSRSNSGPLSS